MAQCWSMIRCNLIYLIMNSQQHYSPFSPSARKWLITIGTLAIALTLFYAMTTGVVSNLNY